jgi:hypothetical protein
LFYGGACRKFYHSFSGGEALQEQASRVFLKSKTLLARRLFLPFGRGKKRKLGERMDREKPKQSKCWFQHLL